MDTLPEEEIALLMILAGPAGSGKTTLCERMVAEGDSIERVVTCTTRQPREGEVDGNDYYFLSNEAFDERIEEGAFLEWAKVHANRYGTLRGSIEEKLSQQIDLVLNVDVQGVSAIREASRSHDSIAKRLITVFIMPASLDELRQRLRGRGQDDDDEIDRRIRTAEKEIESWKEFDFVIRSASRESDFAAVQSIWKAEKNQVARFS